MISNFLTQVERVCGVFDVTMFSIYALRKPNCRGIVNLSVYVLLKAGLLTIKNINYKKNKKKNNYQT